MEKQRAPALKLFSGQGAKYHPHSHIHPESHTHSQFTFTTHSHTAWLIGGQLSGLGTCSTSWNTPRVHDWHRKVSKCFSNSYMWLSFTFELSKCNSIERAVDVSVWLCHSVCWPTPNKCGWNRTGLKCFFLSVEGSAFATSYNYVWAYVPFGREP